MNRLVHNNFGAGLFFQQENVAEQNGLHSSFIGW